MLEIHEESVSTEITLWTLSGRLDGAGALTFDQNASALPDRVRHIILDCAGIAYLSSAGVRELIKLNRTVKAREGRLVIAAITPFVEQVLDMSGLIGQFERFATSGEARAALDVARDDARREVTVNTRRYDVRPLTPIDEPVLEWGSFAELFHAQGVAAPRTSASLSELGLSFGFGGLGFDAAQAEAAHGLFVSTGRLLATQPADGSGVTDFVKAPKPAETLFHCSAAYSLPDQPHLYIQGHADVPVRECLKDIAALAGSPSLMAVVLWAESPHALGRYFRTRESLQAGQAEQREEMGTRRTLYVALCARSNPGWPDVLTHRLDGFHAFGCGCWFEHESDAHTALTLRDALATLETTDTLDGVAGFQPDMPLRRIQAWVFLPQSIEAAATKRLDIAVKEGDPLRDEWDAITRRIYHDASKVELTPLSGGYSATTYQASSYDREGRRQLPTVLKISTLDFALREAKAYHDYVEKFILNNSTVIMGQATRGEWSGLRYNFLGITGPDSKLSWLTHHYRRRPVEELDPIFDHLFSRILYPWYGQAREESIALYDDNNPTHLFKGLLDVAKDVMGVTPDAPTIPCEPLGRELPNPYWVLQNTYRERAGWTMPWFRAISHGDLNMQNILLDEKENLYVIDFSETRPRNVYSDFARLEPIFKFEMIAQPDEAELARLLKFEEGLFRVSATDETPPCDYDGNDPMVYKAHHTLALLRRLACQYTPGRNDLVPYLLALLEWTYPVIYYAQLPELQKRYAMYSTALILERLLDITE